MASEEHPEQANSAPGELEVVRAFVNTLDVEEPEPEVLAQPVDLAAWLAEHELTRARVDAKPADLKRARELREALRTLMLANNGYESEVDEPLAVMNRAAERAKVGVAFTAQDYRVAPGAGGVDEGIGNLLAIIARAMNDGTWQRLKICGEDTCQWAFYDRSKNRSARWCTMAECGNRSKARAFRERQRSKRSRQPS